MGFTKRELLAGGAVGAALLYAAVPDVEKPLPYQELRRMVIQEETRDAVRRAMTPSDEMQRALEAWLNTHKKDHPFLSLEEQVKRVREQHRRMLLQDNQQPSEFPSASALLSGPHQ